MDCAEAKLQIEPYVAGEIPPEVKSALEEHLGACGECRLDVELTRASRNTPPEAAPPALVEPIDPGGAEGVPAEATAAGPTPTPTGDSWTLDSIFGSGGSTKQPAIPPVAESPAMGAPSDDAAGAASADAAAVPVPPAPPAEPEPPSRPAPTPVFATSADEALPPLLTPAPPRKSDEPPPSDAPNWDFEPVEPNGKAKPPEGSLFFAKEALSRGTPPKKGSPAARLALWAGGGVLGVGLLAASIWIALTMHPPLPPAVHGTRSERTPGASQVSGPGSPSIAHGAPTDSIATGGAPSSPPASAPAAPPTVATAPPTVATAPPPPVTPPAPPVVSTTPVPSSGASKAYAPRAQAPARTRKDGPGPAIRKTMSRSEALARTEAPPKAEPPATTQTPATHATHARTSKSGGDAAARAPAGSASAPPAETPRPADSAPASETIDLETGKTEPGTAPKAAAPAPGAATEPTATSSPEENVERPIDRLHLATLAAEQNADLPGLRKMRDTWHGFLKTSLGPDRARAKRELADCLWAIQTLTSKTSDQKEALAAYRDYVLNAPAGGADARTVARMRQLEDALTESR